MKNLIKRLFRIDKLQVEKIKAEEELAKVKQAAEIAKMTPKEQATARGEPWVAVLDTHVNKDNIRNGFFELDWNEIFVQELIESGYGYEADPPEQIVDRWFRDLARNMLAEEGVDPNRSTSGYINVSKISKTQSEIS